MLDFSSFRGRPLCGAGIGEVLFDVIDGRALLGGAPANFAYHCTQLGLPCAVVSAVGADELGRRATAELSSRNLRLLLPTVSYPTGRVTVTLDAAGVAQYDFLADTAYDHIPFDDDTRELAAGLSLACYGSLAQRGEESAAHIRAFLSALPEKSVRVFDVNLRGSFYSRAQLEATLELSNAFKCNEDELPVLARLLNMRAAAPDFFADLRTRYGCELFIFTEGAKQSQVFLNDEHSQLPSTKVEVADTVGAGDAFTAALLTGLLRGLPLAEAHRHAVAVSAFVCTQHGAMPALPAELTAAFKAAL